MNYHASLRVPIIPQDLRHEETIVQIAAALDLLASASSNVFQHISSHIQKSTTQLSKLQSRCQVIRAKVDKLSGTNNATKVFSSAKYPAQDIFTDYQCHYINDSPCPKKVPIRSKPIPVEEQMLNDKLQLIHIKESSHMFRRNVEIAPEEGLGSLPNDMDYVSSLLLFNTSQNLYKRYVMSDPLDKDSKSKNNVNGEEKEHIEAAPLSMSQKEQSELKDAFTFSYSPTSQEVPQLDLPLDLPDLPGIAGDLRYSIDLDPMITPSIPVVSPPAFSNLPNLNAETSSELAPPPPLPPVLPEIKVLPTPPPPPPIPNDELLASLLPTAAMSEMEKSVQPAKESKIEIPKPFCDDTRTNLMEAIRNAGGSSKAKLRSIDRKQEAKQAREELKIGGGDLIAELHDKLAMRRKGISGEVKDELGGDGLMKRMLTLIPVHPKQDGNAELEEDNDDWDE